MTDVSAWIIVGVSVFAGAFGDAVYTRTEVGYWPWTLAAKARDGKVRIDE